MSMQILGARAQLLQAEVQRAKQNLIDATEKLEQAKAHFNMVSGHLNEVGYLIGEEQKLANQGAVPPIPSVADSDQKDNQGGHSNGEVDDKGQE